MRGDIHDGAQNNLHVCSFMETSQLYGAGLFAWALSLVLVRQKCCSPNDVAANSSTIPESFIQEFIERGVVVIPGVLSPGEVDLTRRKFHEYLAKNGVS